MRKGAEEPMIIDIVSAIRKGEAAVEDFKQQYMLKSPEVLVGYPRPQLMMDLEQSGWLKRLRLAWRIVADFPSYEEDMRRCAHYYGADFRLTGRITAIAGCPGTFQLIPDGLIDGQNQVFLVWSPSEDGYLSAELQGQHVALFLRNDERNKSIPLGVALRVHALPLRPDVPHTLADLRIARGFVHTTRFMAGFPQSALQHGEQHA